jgi:hypothetical protein
MKQLGSFVATPLRRAVKHRLSVALAMAPIFSSTALVAQTPPPVYPEVGPTTWRTWLITVEISRSFGIEMVPTTNKEPDSESTSTENWCWSERGTTGADFRSAGTTPNFTNSGERRRQRLGRTSVPGALSDRERILHQPL